MCARLFEPQVDAMENANWEENCTSNKKPPEALPKAGKYMG